MPFIPIPKSVLKKQYVDNKCSAAEIAVLLDCSENKVNYWLGKYNIKKRTVSEAIYIKSNPNGDPFQIQKYKTLEDAYLHGLGIGLYWGEGTKSNKHCVRLGNTDPNLIKRFIEFLERSYKIDRNKLRFGLQIFSDMNSRKARKIWCDALSVSVSQFQKVVVTPARGDGNYRHKTQHGVLTVQFNNKKLRDIIVNEIESL